MEPHRAGWAGGPWSENITGCTGPSRAEVRDLIFSRAEPSVRLEFHGPGQASTREFIISGAGQIYQGPLGTPQGGLGWGAVV